MADDIRPLQVAGCYEAPAAVNRSADRERAAREFAAQVNPPKSPQQLMHEQWAAEAKAEAEKKVKDEKDAIARGAVKILPDGTRVEYFSGNRRM